jgi:hypothetical protein
MCAVLTLLPARMLPAALPQVINFWTGVQEYDANGQPLAESKPPTIEEARAEFPDCVFMGA